MNENLLQSAHSSLEPLIVTLFIRTGEGPRFGLSDFMRQHHRAQVLFLFVGMHFLLRWQQTAFALKTYSVIFCYFTYKLHPGRCIHHCSYPAHS